MTRRGRVGLCTLAILVGALLAPFSIILSLESLPSLSSAALYGLLGFVFGLLSPDWSWRWGFWVTLGIPMAVLLIPIAHLVDLSLNLRPGTPFTLGFLWMTLAFGYLPGLFAGAARSPASDSCVERLCEAVPRG